MSELCFLYSGFLITWWECFLFFSRKEFDLGPLHLVVVGNSGISAEALRVDSTAVSCSRACIMSLSFFKLHSIYCAASADNR